jgi:hypothetical protein
LWSDFISLITEENYQKICLMLSVCLCPKPITLSGFHWTIIFIIFALWGKALIREGGNKNVIFLCLPQVSGIHTYYSTSIW